MWEISKVDGDEEVQDYWVLSKGTEVFGAFFNKTVAERVLAFLNNKWIHP